MDDANQKIIDQIEKLARVAAKTDNPEEAAAFTAKVNDLLARHNLTMSEVESASTDGTSGKRMDEQVSGGMYKYQRKLWRSLAELHFCMYFTLLVRTKEGTRKFKRGRKLTYEHRLVGRAVNVIATKNVGTYLNQTIERICREKFLDKTDVLVQRTGNQFYTRDAVAFREGMADRIIEKIEERRGDLKRQEALRIKKEAREAAKKGLSVETALTLAGVSDREKQANYDFLHGEGAWARKEAAAAERQKRWAEEAEAEAKAEREAEVAYAEWAEAHPEEAAKIEAERIRKERARARRRMNRGYGSRYFAESKEDRRYHSSAYHRGVQAGEAVSIDPQVDAGRRRISHGS